MSSLLRNIQRNNRLYSRKFSSDKTTVVYSWGLGTNGQLGHAKFEATSASILSTSNDYVQKIPRRLVKSKNLKKFACGNEFTIALTSSGELIGFGNLEDVGIKNKKILQPTAISFEHKFRDIACGKNHCAAIDLEGQVYTWGVGSFGNSWVGVSGGHLGHSSLDSVALPRLVKSFSEYRAKATSVSCGEKHTLVLTDDGEVLSCGVGEYGRLGTGRTEDCTVPMTIESLLDHDIVQVAAGASHSLALTKEGEVFAWGRNDMGQLGAGDSFMDIYSMEEFPRAIDVDSLQGKAFVYVAAGKGRSAAVTRDGELFLWGNKLHHVPTQVNFTENFRVKRVFCGGSSGKHCVAVITEDGELWTMGEGDSHILGRLNAKTKNPTFERVPGLEGKMVVDVAMGFGNHIIALVVEDASQ